MADENMQTKHIHRKHAHISTAVCEYKHKEPAPREGLAPHILIHQPFVHQHQPNPFQSMNKVRALKMNN